MAEETGENEEQISNEDSDGTQLLVNQRTPLASSAKYQKIRRYFYLSLVLVLCLLALLFGLVVTLIVHRAQDGGDRGNRPFPDRFAFYHLSDLHTDLYYSDGIASKPTFCRNAAMKNHSAVPAPFQARFGRVGCDSPRALIDSLVHSMQEVHSATEVDTIKFIVVSGDLSAHRLGNMTPYGPEPLRTLDAIRYVSHSLSSNFSNLPFYPCIGNNDLVGDYTLPPNKTFYKELLNIWAPLILCRKCAYKGTTSKELNATFLNGGYYKVSINDGLTLLVLNTVYWSSRAVPDDPIVEAIANHQMDWLIENLKRAFGTDTKVVILGHIPPSIDLYSGKPLWKDLYVEKYVEKVASVYKKQVTAQLFGHLHKDMISLQRGAEFPLTKADDVGAVLLAPAVSPVYRNNPGYRLVQSTPLGRIIDYEQYYLDLVLSTEFNRPLWQKSYRFREAYQSIIGNDETITPTVLSRLVEKLIDQNSTGKIWETYSNNRQVGYQLDPFDRFGVYCAAKHVTLQAFNACRQKYNVTGG